MVGQSEKNNIQGADRRELMKTAIRAIVGKLDSDGLLRSNDMAFLSANEVSQANETVQQKIGGIGAVLKLDEATREVLVGTPLPDSPALKAGLMAGDRILEIDGNGLPQGKEIQTAVALLRGAPGSVVTVGVKRAGSAQLRKIELVRDT